MVFVNIFLYPFPIFHGAGELWETAHMWREEVMLFLDVFGDREYLWLLG